MQWKKQQKVFALLYYYASRPAEGRRPKAEGWAGGIVFFYQFMICTYQVQEKKTFKLNSGYYGQLQLKWLLCVHWTF